MNFTAAMAARESSSLNRVCSYCEQRYPGLGISSVDPAWPAVDARWRIAEARGSRV